jgi:hypothetical protein
MRDTYPLTVVSDRYSRLAIWAFDSPCVRRHPLRLADDGRSGEAVVASGLVKSYGRVQAVRGVDLRIDRGETVAVLGPNGAGKPNIGLQHFFVPHVSCSPASGAEVGQHR